jgi:type II secretory pathway pseudopilin PulG
LADEKGDTLVEILVAVAIIAIVITAFLTALSTGVFGVARVRRRVTAENLARAQLEYVKNHTYDPGTDSYPIIEYLEEDYSITVDVSYWNSSTQSFTTDSDVDPVECGMQWITVTVSYDGEPIFAVADYKLDR